MRVDQWVPALHAGDAIGDSARLMRDAFRRLGHEADVYALDLDPDCPHFRRHLRTVPIVDANNRRMRIPSWKQNLRPDQLQMLDDLLGPELAHFGYV